jgi:hypothetical protein
MTRRLLIVLLTAVSVLALASCRPVRAMTLPAAPDDKGGPPPTGNIAYQPPFLPITLKVGFDGNVSVSASPKLVTSLGTFSVEGGAIVSTASQKPLAPKPADVTRLVVCLDDTDRRCNVYQIDSGRRLRVLLDGKVVEDIERNLITIHAAPGATVVVSDRGPATNATVHGPAKIDIEEFDFSAQGPDTDVDLERSRSGYLADLTYDHVNGELTLINGAQISRVQTYTLLTVHQPASNVPGEFDCQQATDWRSSFAAKELEHNTIVSCVKTAEGDLGYIFLVPYPDEKPVSYYAYTYVWVRSAETSGDS